MRIRQLLGLGLLIVGLSACQGQPVPLSAQRGSTILIPLSDTSLTGEVLVGYGDMDLEDYQRGTMIFQLGGPDGFELETRGATAVRPSRSAKHSSTVQFWGQQLVAVVDIPEDAPLGTHSLHIVTRRVEGGVPEDHPGPTYAGSIAILPHEITAGSETIVGAQTPFKHWVCIGGCTLNDISFLVPDVIPRPELHVALSGGVGAFELRVDYPASVIDVVDAFHSTHGLVSANARGLVWLDDDGLGTATLSGASTAPGALITDLVLVFELDDGPTAILDETDVTVSVIKATDENGVVVTRTASATGIF